MQRNGIRRMVFGGIAVTAVTLLGQAESFAQYPDRYSDGDSGQTDRREQPPNQDARPNQPPAGAQLPGTWLPTASFRDTEWGDVPHYGDANRPSRGYPHYDWPNERYGQWYRPQAFGLGQYERCQPRPFRPRGYGNLSNRPKTCYRMDYHPYVLKDPTTEYGPSYYLRQPDERCPGDELVTLDQGPTRWYRCNVCPQLHRVCDSACYMLRHSCVSALKCPLGLGRLTRLTGGGCPSCER